MEAEPSLTPGSGASVKLPSMHDTLMPDTFSFPTGASNRSSNDEPCSSAVEVEPHTRSNTDPHILSTAEPSFTPGSGTFVKLQGMHDTVMPDTFSFPTGASNRSSNDEPCSGAVEVEPHTRSNTNPHILSMTSAGSNNQQLEPSISVKVKCHSQTSPSLPPPKSENDATTSRELILYESEPNPAVDIANSRSNVHIEVAYNELHQRQDPDSSHQALQSDHKYTSPWRSSEDGYNWRKYGQKHIKGSECPRSYYKCSHANCQVKKQVERSHNGRITEVVYKGKHDHPRPQSNIQMSACTMSTIQAERSNGVSFSNNTKDKSLNGHGQSSVQPKTNGAPEVPLVLASHNNVEGAAEKLIRVRDAVDDDDELESKRRRLNSNPDTPERSEDQQHKPSVQPKECLSQATASSCLVENVNASLSSHELTLSVTAPNPSVDVLTSGTIVPFGADSDDLEQRSDSGVQAVQSDYKGTTRFVAAERLWGDGYQWRKYGQKHIKGSESPRSYYRCTHPNCQVKKQLERSHDGKITDIIYKGEHDHPKPQPSSHMAVGRFLSIQEEGSNKFSSLSSSEDKSLNRPNQLTHHAEPKGGLELTPILAKNDGVQGEGSQSNHTGDNRSPESSSKHMMLNKEININTAADSNHKQDNASTKSEGQCQSQTSVSSPSAKTKITDASCHELTPSITASNPPVYMVTSRGIVPVEVDSDELRQRQGSDSGVQSTQSDQNGISIAMTERLLENAYHWRKYGQKNIKGSEFPRSYYRCTYSGCQVKMQLERSHDGRIIEIIYKGKHDHPKPQPISRMAIGAILSLEEEKSDRFCLSHTEGKSSNGHAQTSLDANQNGTPELSHITAIDDDVDCAAAKFSRKREEVENDGDPELKHRKKDTGDVDLIPVVRAPKEARIVVETLSDFDVVDDGYRWQKYGRKMVKGNPNPRNYYRCSNAACPVKKHVERASHNPKAVVTTYEGKHNHDLPPPRSIGQDIFQKIGSSDTSTTRCEENDAISLDVGRIATSCDPKNKPNDKDEITVEPLQTDSRYVSSDCSSKVTETDMVLPHNGDPSGIADPNKSRKDEGESFSFDTPSLKMES